VRWAAAFLASCLLLTGCPEDRGTPRQRVPAARVPAAVAVEPTLPPLPLPPAALEPGEALTSGR